MNRLKALRTILLSALPLLIALPPVQAQSPFDDSLRKGSEAMQSGNFADAEKWFKAAVAANPEDPSASMQLGVVELRMGKPDEAIHALNETIRRVPQQPGPHLFLGIAYVQMHRLDEAASTLKQEIELDPKNAQAQMWLGVVEMQAGHPELATGPLDRAAELSPNDLNILEYRGKAHSDVAYASYARMATIDPNSWHVHKVQAQMYAEQKLRKEAIAEYLEAIKIVPNNSDLYEELGNEYRQDGSLELAQQAFRKELELSPNNPVAMYNLAKIDIETNDPEGGLKLLDKVIANYKNVSATYFYLGLGLFETGKAALAVDALEKARTMHPEADLAARIEYELSRAYRKLGRLDDSSKAIHEYTRLKALNTKVNPAVKLINTAPPPANAPASEARGEK